MYACMRSEALERPDKTPLSPEQVRAVMIMGSPRAAMRRVCGQAPNPCADDDERPRKVSVWNIAV